jgi:hypothetical protein
VPSLERKDSLAGIVKFNVRFLAFFGHQERVCHKTFEVVSEGFGFSFKACERQIEGNQLRVELVFDKHATVLISKLRHALSMTWAEHQSG